MADEPEVVEEMVPGVAEEAAEDSQYDEAAGVNEVAGANADASVEEKVEGGERPEPRADAGKWKKAILSNKKIVGGIAAVAVVVVALVVGFIFMNANRGPSFRSLYEEYCDESIGYATLAKDGSYLELSQKLSLDTISNGDWSSFESARDNINKALGIPKSLSERIGKTKASDGKRSERFEDLGVEVEWEFLGGSDVFVSIITYRKI